MVNMGHKPVYWAAIRDRFEILRYLIEEKEAVYEVADMKGFTVLDHAIVNGNYDITKYLYDKGLRFKSLDFYQLEKDRYFQFEVDFESVIEHVVAGKTSCKLIFRKIEPVTFKDPVADPRESWGEWASRISEFKEPVIVERESLPENLRPENRGMMGRMSNYFNKQTMKCYTKEEIKEAEVWDTEQENIDEENKNSVIPPKEKKPSINNAVAPIDIKPEKIDKKPSEEIIQENKSSNVEVKMEMMNSQKLDKSIIKNRNDLSYGSIEMSNQEHVIGQGQNIDPEENQEDGFRQSDAFMTNTHNL